MEISRATLTNSCPERGGRECPDGRSCRHAVEVHAVGWRDCGLEGYGKPTVLERSSPLRRLWEPTARDCRARPGQACWRALPEPARRRSCTRNRVGNTISRARPARLNAIFAGAPDRRPDADAILVATGRRSRHEDPMRGLTAVTRRGLPTRTSCSPATSSGPGARVDVRGYRRSQLESAVFLEGYTSGGSPAAPRTLLASRAGRAGARQTQADATEIATRRRPHHRLFASFQAFERRGPPADAVRVAPSERRRATASPLETGALGAARFEPPSAGCWGLVRAVIRAFGGMGRTAMPTASRRPPRRRAQRPASNRCGRDRYDQTPRRVFDAW